MRDVKIYQNHQKKDFRRSVGYVLLFLHSRYVYIFGALKRTLFWSNAYRYTLGVVRAVLFATTSDVVYVKCKYDGGSIFFQK